MSLNAKDYKQESKFETPAPLEAGTYPARVVQVISLGLQKQQPYKGEPKPPKDDLYVTYELLDEFLLDEDGEEDLTKPRWQSETFPMNSLDSDLAKSTKRYLAIDPTMAHDGDWAELIGAACMVTLVQNPGKGNNSERIFNNVASVQTMRTKEASKASPLVNKGKVFDISSPDMEVFFALPKFLQDKMKGNLNFAGSALEKATEAHGEGPGGGTTQKEEKPPQEGVQEVSEDSEEEDDEGW